MGKRFRLLKFFSVVFKVLSICVLLILAIALVRAAIGPAPQMPDGTPMPARIFLVTILNTTLSLLIVSVTFYAFGEVIRILRAIEEQTRKS